MELEATCKSMMIIRHNQMAEHTDRIVKPGKDK